MSIPIPEEILTKVRQQKAILTEKGITQELFREAVRKRTREGNTSFVLAVYQTFDEFFEREVSIFGAALSCKKGCSRCCYTLITSTEMEIDEVIHFINNLSRPVRMSLVRRIRVSAREWRDYYTDNQLAIRMNPAKLFIDWQDRPCPFLDEDDSSCSIYPVRIVDCRTLSSLIPCVFPGMNTLIPCEVHTEGPGRYRFRCEAWASNLIMEEQFSSVTPVHHWLWLKRKEF